ncbi:MAG: hypothetical protein B6226_06275, partial [Candidatus Cloacimonetes bacterium 4572_65]
MSIWIDNYKERISYNATAKVLAHYGRTECMIITDENLNSLYGKSLFNDQNLYVIPSGEKNKTFNQVNAILEYMLTLHLPRNITVIGFGGGVVCDIAGFVSAIYKRGVPLHLLPTSLLAMVDAAVGGKNGVNSKELKNQFGSIKQPSFINYDIKLLKTLPNDEFYNGIGEMLKHGLIYSQDYFDRCVEFFKKKTFEKLDYTILEELVKESIDIKLHFVEEDEADMGKRRVLNFGHTLGHIIERRGNHGHGVSVIWGMIKAINYSLGLSLITPKKSEYLLKSLNIFNIIEGAQLSWFEVE